ncbi:NADH dehydrogenase subunit 2 (mitochondrion) [Sarcophilus harrisii]|uniref:NADH-ubiquinone oxidoreductase chain 2 n=1 Tax=Sarcophilus harrisii TaxID=9305 RepID=G8XYV5_SARHA|nr:NADH dehydrogenase subunit 2 [Sarcophilus harrisii]AFR45063.1 NADH dehydrogenase subunit 2 [Sarcophilus harrisii]AFR45076.1 NADH dehydrogenase subunit 2 [Sarcophilus harrisii]AFR45102.1 NADH dehydrogenase subunit 2 [Sarcophilus harrisii]AFR45115.1 NADH dehydrogenase subunit 2 [Sarcophilus harrisii]AFR45128.1 NADH dehydrogenase subunit 2 [Sarcophilus harrisii]
MSPYVTTILTLSLFIGTCLTIFSEHWFTAWMGLEINTLAIIPMMTTPKNPRATEAATKYFLTQSTASMVMMFAIIYNAWSTNQWTLMQLSDNWASIAMTLALAIKLGLAPFHFWVPEVTQGIPLLTGMILLTWQKLAPTAILFQIAPHLNMKILIMLAILSTLVGGWGGLNQTHLRKILAYSSIAHMGWMIIIVQINPTLTILSLTIYIMATLTMFLTLNLSNVTKIKSLGGLWNKSATTTIIILLTLLSLGGLPPLTGFMPKWLILQELINNNNIMTATLMALSALLNLFFYMRLIYASSLTMFPSTNNSKMQWYNNPTQITMLIPTTTVISSLLLPLTPLFITLS